MTRLVFAFLAVCLVQVVLGQDDSCYINESGFTCCNRELEASMKSAMSGNDLLGTADSVQSGAQDKFGGKFETVVSMDDFSSKTHFKEGKSCKVEKGGQIASAWQP